MMAPRLTGNLRAIAVDPDDARNIYVGTEEGTLAHSLDGGVTWEEIELSPFLLQSPTVAVTLDGDPFKQIDVFAGFHVLDGELWRAYTPHRRDSAAKGIILAGPPNYGLAPDYIKADRFDGVKEPLLGAVAGADPRPYEDVQRIKVCPGANFGLFVTTPSKLLGSPDGTTFVPLFIARDSAPIGDVACSPTNPNEVILTTGDGTFRSTDGGTSFDPMGGRFGPTGSTAIAFGPPGENGKSQLYVATGRDLWIGDSSDPESMHTVSTGGDSNGDIKSIAPSPQAVWIATEGGVRVSRDMGTTWIPANELEGSAWEKVAVAANGQQVAVLREDIAYESTDGGNVFRPLFRGESRRRLRQISALPASPGASAGFLLLTNGELWTTSAPIQAAARNDKVSRWAEQRLKNMPSLTDTIERALAKAHIAPAQIEELASALKARAWLPGVHVSFGAGSFNQLTQQTTTVATQSALLTAETRDVYQATVQLIWELPDLVAPSYNFTPARNDLYGLRKRYSYVVEDAYVERRHVLSQFLNGSLDTEQFLTLQARLEVLDIVLQEFTADQGGR
jgi:photosystem II stability/assembly factor-like uncharacterized protein